MARIVSYKLDHTGHRGAKAMRIMVSGRLRHKDGVVFTDGALVLNFTNGERAFMVMLDFDETGELVHKLARRPAPEFER